MTEEFIGFCIDEPTVRNQQQKMKVKALKLIEKHFLWTKCDKRNSTYGIGKMFVTKCGKRSDDINFKPTQNDGSNISRPIAKNSDSFSLSKHFGSMLNEHLITFCVVNRIDNFFALNSVPEVCDLM